MPPPLWPLTFDLLTSKVVSESRVTWATSVPILVFLGLSVLDLGPMYATDRRRRHQTSDAHHRLMPQGVGIIQTQDFQFNGFCHSRKSQFSSWNFAINSIFMHVLEVAKSYRHFSWNAYFRTGGTIKTFTVVLRLHCVTELN